jgi:cytochrome P450
VTGRDLITDVPSTRWLTSDYYDPDPAAPDKTYCWGGGFLDAVDFDPVEFGKALREQGIPESQAGNVTTTDLIGHGVLALLNHPDQLAKLRANPKLAQSAVEEMLRYDPPITQRNRVTTQPSSIGGVEVPAGHTISTSIQAAGRDPSHYSDPHRFDIEREDSDHLAFGGGAHYCVGAPLARAEAQVAIPLLFDRFPHIRLDPQHPIEHKSSPFFNGLKALWGRIKE